MTLPAFAIAALDRHFAPVVQRKIDTKTKPSGALGRLEALALQIALIQGAATPRLNLPQVLLFAGDHGAVAEGISAYPQDVTWQMVLNFLTGGAAINVFARQNGLTVRVVDAGVKHDFAPHPALIAAKVGYGTRNFIHEPAMTAAQCATAIRRGAALVEDCHQAGANVIGCGEMGIGNTSSAALLVHRVLDLPLAHCVGSGTGLDARETERKLAVLTRASARCPDALPPLALLGEFGGFEIAMMVGAFLAAAAARMVVLVDGFIATAALVIAQALHPAMLDYCVFAHTSAERGHRAVLQRLGAAPLLDLGMRLGEGTGAAVCYPLLQAAVNFLAEMASFAEAGVDEKSGV